MRPCFGTWQGQFWGQSGDSARYRPETTGSTALSPSNSPPTQISTRGEFNSSRGCRGTFGSVGTAEATQIEADFTGTDCQLATFTGRIVLTKGMSIVSCSFRATARICRLRSCSISPMTFESSVTSNATPSIWMRPSRPYRLGSEWRRLSNLLDAFTVRRGLVTDRRTRTALSRPLRGTRVRARMVWSAFVKLARWSCVHIRRPHPRLASAGELESGSPD